MALRALMKRRELDRLNKQLEDLRKQAEGFEKREAEIAEMINEAETEEERAAVEDEVSSFEQERDQVNGEIADLEERVDGIEAELEEIENNQDPEPTPAPDGNERGAEPIMNVRTKLFANMDIQRRNAIFAQEDVQSFLTNVRSIIKNKRAVSGGDLLVPDVFLGLIRENIMDFSKLYRHVNLRPVAGEGNAAVMGTIPEAVWTDCCGNLNELDIGFNGLTVGCWKVGGFVPVCNATLQDSDIDLAAEVLTVIGQAIGYALDKAIIFGLGTRMPLGFFTRLAQTTKPSDYPPDEREWTNLSSSNIKTIASTVKGIDLFREFILDSGAAKGKYSRGEKVWAMNETTYTALIANALVSDAAGAIVAGVNGTMPVIGGIIEVLDFIPDNMIFGGYLDLYLLSERAGVTLDQSEHVRFLADQTVFRGTARYDGKPAIAEGFVAIGINGTTPSASGITFAPDTANAESE